MNSNLRCTEAGNCNKLICGDTGAHEYSALKWLMVFATAAEEPVITLLT